MCVGGALRRSGGCSFAGEPRWGPPQCDPSPHAPFHLTCPSPAAGPPGSCNTSTTMMSPSFSRVDVAHLVLYHLSVCCKKKYFDFDREILPFTSENWDSLLLGELSDTPKGERSSKLLLALNSHKDRFISGREIKKRKCLFGLHARTPPPVEPPTGSGAPTRAGPWGRGLTSPGEAPEAGARAPEEEAEGETGGAGASLSSAPSARGPGAEGAGSSAEGAAGFSVSTALQP